MSSLKSTFLAVLIGLSLSTGVSAQNLPERAVRRTIPMTNAIRHAFDAGTRNSTGRPGPNYWQLKTDYVIDASLDPAKQVISGTETITLHNTSPDELSTIVLRLDHNIFRGDVPRGSSVPAEQTEGMVVTRIAVDGHEIDLFAREPETNWYEPPPAWVGVEGLTTTRATVRLDRPVPARSTVTLVIDWHTKLPGGPNGEGHRMTQRWEDRLFQPTQWFPRVANYDDLRGWDQEVYLGPAEFYNNFGRFDVRINVPGGWLVSGTGLLQNPKEVLTATARERLATVTASDDEIMIVDEGETKTAAGKDLVWHFVADNVNDFAWAASKDYVWRATRATIPGRGPIPIHMLYLPERASEYVNAGTISRHALEFYSELWAPYPFPQLTLQDGPSSGMEYPMVINSNQGAADHEIGHQWWPMVVSNNETWYGWMDEGFNSYMNILSYADATGSEPDLNSYGAYYGRISGDESEPIMMWTANYGSGMYRFQTYQKAPLMLSMLGGIVGDAAVQKAMSEYTKEWSFKHPSPWDYAHFMQEALGTDLGWFWYYWLWTTESVDGSITNVQPAGGATRVTVRQDGEMPSPVVLAVTFAETGPDIVPMDNAVMKDDRTAVVTWPVDVWFSGNRTFDAVVDFGGRSIERVVLDPGCRFPDRNTGDNVWPRTDNPNGVCRDVSRRR